MWFPNNAIGDARQVPEVRRGLLDLAVHNGIWHQSEGIRMLSELEGSDGFTPNQIAEASEGCMERAENAMAWSRRSLEEAQLMWVSPELCDVLYASVGSLPADVVLDISHPPSPAGFVVLGTPFIGIDALGIHASKVEVNALMWGPVKLPPRDEWPYGTKGVLPGFGLAAFKYMPDIQQWLPLGRSDWLFGDDVVRATHDNIDVEGQGHASMMEDRMLFAALWALIQQKRLVDSTFVQADKPARKRLARRGDTTRPDVEIIHLRRAAYRSQESDSTGRKIGVRFVVRPFWRNQPCGPGNKSRKLILIAAHMKGPEDAPLQHTERIWSLDQ